MKYHARVCYVKLYLLFYTQQVEKTTIQVLLNYLLTKVF